MRYVDPLDDLLRSQAAVRILRVLLQHPAKEFTGRELARLARVSPTKASQQLEALLRQGMVHRRTVGRSHGWRIVREHVLTEALRDLFSTERTSLARLQRLLLRGLKGIRLKRLVLFGSVARGEERPDSDVDLLVVVPSAAEKSKAIKRLLFLGQETQAHFGNALSPHVYTTREAAAQEGSALMENVRREGIELRRATP